jgi:hypothetical protein
MQSRSVSKACLNAHFVCFRVSRRLRESQPLATEWLQKSAMAAVTARGSWYHLFGSSTTLVADRWVASVEEGLKLADISADHEVLERG